MRITAETKQRTREKIVEAARHLFSEKGFEPTTTRDIAIAAKIASGTLFNYFPSKEALAMCITAEALDAAHEDFRKRRRGDESLEEDLFLHVVTGLRRLRPYRHFVGAVIETAMSPFSRSPLSEDADRVRTEHLETVAELIANHGAIGAPSFVIMHLYWTLYLGVLAFWSHDASPHQEETFAVLDQSLRLFTASLSSEPINKMEIGHDT